MPKRTLPADPKPTTVTPYTPDEQKWLAALGFERSSYPPRPGEPPRWYQGKYRFHVEEGTDPGRVVAMVLDAHRRQVIHEQKGAMREALLGFMGLEMVPDMTEAGSSDEYKLRIEDR